MAFHFIVVRRFVWTKDPEEMPTVALLLAGPPMPGRSKSRRERELTWPSSWGIVRKVDSLASRNGTGISRTDKV